MKTTLIFLLLSISTIAFCQNYQPIPTQNMEWLEQRGYLDIQGKQMSWCASHLTKTNGDTLIQGLKYHKLDIIRIIHFDPFGGSWQCDWSISGPIIKVLNDSVFFRNDSANKLVYVRYKNDTAEKVLYDFNLQIGDTLDFGHFKNTFAHKVDSIKYINYQGISRKTFYISYGKMLIEGIGFQNFFWGPRFSESGNYSNSSDLVGVCHNGNNIYNNSSLVLSLGFPYPNNSCNLITRLDEAVESMENFKIYPNPIQEKTTIEFSLNEQGTIDLFVYDALGQLVYNQTSQSYSTGINQIELDKNDITRDKGVYFLELRINGKSNVKKLIVL